MPVFFLPRDSNLTLLRLYALVLYLGIRILEQQCNQTPAPCCCQRTFFPHFFFVLFDPRVRFRCMQNYPYASLYLPCDFGMQKPSTNATSDRPEVDAELGFGAEVVSFARPKRVRPGEDGVYNINYDGTDTVHHYNFLYGLIGHYAVLENGTRLNLELMQNIVHQAVENPGVYSFYVRTFAKQVAAEVADRLLKCPDSLVSITVWMPARWIGWNARKALPHLFPDPTIASKVQNIQVQLRGSDCTEEDLIDYHAFFPELKCVSFVNAPSGLDLAGTEGCIPPPTPFSEVMLQRCMVGRLKGFYRSDDDGLSLLPTNPNATVEPGVAREWASALLTEHVVDLSMLTDMLNNIHPYHPSVFQPALSERAAALSPAKAVISNFSVDGLSQLSQYMNQFLPYRITNNLRVISITKIDDGVLSSEFIEWVSDTFLARLLFHLPQDPEDAQECSRLVRKFYGRHYTVIEDASVASKNRLLLERN